LIISRLMIELGIATENEMVLAFLRAEADSPRFGWQVLPGIEQQGFSRTQLLDSPDLNNAQQNEARRLVLRNYRGFGGNSALFRGFPAQVSWRRVAVEPGDYNCLLVANYRPLVCQTQGTRRISRLAARVTAGEITCEIADNVKGIQDELMGGKKFPELIGVEGSEGNLILIEGHSRATAYMGFQWTKNIEMILGRSPLLHQWQFY
jgi:hypothetical protein